MAKTLNPLTPGVIKIKKNLMGEKAKIITVTVFKSELFFPSTVVLPKDADGMANCVDSDQTAPFRSSLIWVCTVCSVLADPVF